ncbi:MAG: DUF4145 domain-containing protein [Nitrospinota bacterium]
MTSKRFKALPEKLFSIYREIIHAYNGSLNVLCAAGARALLEGICEDKGISGKNIEEKVEGLKRLLPANIVDDLHGFRFIGNRALHELEAPSREDLGLAIEIIEDLLNFIYELDYKASRLAAKKPRESSISPDEL